MTDKQPNADDWIGSWIAQQRQLLQAQAAAGRAVSLDELGRRWLDLGEAYLKGLAHQSEPQAAKGNGGASEHAAAQFKLGDDILGAWRNAWAGADEEHAGLGRRFAEILDGMPFLGPSREQAHAWRELSAAQAECRRLGQELAHVLSRVQSDALSLLEQRVRERERAGQPVSNFRALYDLWVECGEHVYAQVAHSDAYSKLQAALGNATMRFKSRQQVLLEHALKQFDLPTRTELNTVHRQVRELRTQIAALEAASHAATPVRRASKPRSSAAKRTPAQSRRKRK